MLSAILGGGDVIPTQYLTAVRNANTAPEQASSGEKIVPLTPAQHRTMTRLRHVALTVFEENGFDGTTADQVSKRAGISVRTFFRYFPTKEDALFCDHVIHLARLDDVLVPDADRVRSSTQALRRILDAYVKDADFVSRRARLVAESPALKDRELLWIEEYQRRLGTYIAGNTSTKTAAIWAHIVAASLLTAFRHVLAAWASGEFSDNPGTMFDQLAAEIAYRFDNDGASSTLGSSVVIIGTELPPAEIARLIRSAEH